MLSIYIVVGALVVGLGVHTIYFVRKLRSVGSSNLSPSDHLAIAAFYVNVFVVLVSVVALQIAVSTYQDAQKSGGEQLQALKDARQAIVDSAAQEKTQLDTATMALQSEVGVAKDQETVLKQSLKTSSDQLAIIKSERELALAQPDVRALLLYPTDLAVIIYNTSQTKVASQVLYELIMLDFDHPVGDKFQSVSTIATTVNYVRPRGSYLPTKLYAIPSPADPPLKVGDRLFGYLSVSCPDCQSDRIYWLYWLYGVDGWYYEGSGAGDYHIFGSMTKSDADEMISNFMSHNGLTKLPTTFQ